jgi:nucleotide-binding universal stress UspA family protein
VVPFLPLLLTGCAPQQASRHPQFLNWSNNVNQLPRILCAVDFSQPAQAAFEQALALGRERNAELTVVHAVPTEQPFGWDARKRIAAIAAFRRAAESAGVRFKVSVQHGNPAGVILLHARSRRPHVIVMGTHQRTGLERLRAGSVAETVALRAACPVLIVPGQPASRVARPSAHFKSILCAVDFSPASTAAVRHALSLATQGKGRVTLVHVAEGVSSTSAFPSVSDRRVPEYRAIQTRAAWRRLQEAASPEERTSGRVHVRVVTGDPAVEIGRIAADVNADLIVVGVTSRGALGRRVFGSTATRVIRTAGRPVLAVPEIPEHRIGPPSKEAHSFAAAA